MDDNYRTTNILKILSIISTLLSIVVSMITILKENKGLWLFVTIFIISITLVIWGLRKRHNGNSSIGDWFNSLIAPTSSSLSAEQADSMLTGLYMSDRVAGIENLLPQLRNQLSGYDAAKILGNLVMSDRVRGIELLKNKLCENLTPQEIEAVLGNLVFSDRTDAISILATKNK